MTTPPTHDDKARDLLAVSQRNNYPADLALVDAQAGVGHALLAIHDDLANLRGDLADIATAVRELAAVQRRPRRRWPLARTEPASLTRLKAPCERDS